MPLFSLWLSVSALAVPPAPAIKFAVDAPPPVCCSHWSSALATTVSGSIGVPDGVPNGMPVWLVNTPFTPLVDVELVLDVGWVRAPESGTNEVLSYILQYEVIRHRCRRYSSPAWDITRPPSSAEMPQRSQPKTGSSQSPSTCRPQGAASSTTCSSDYGAVISRRLSTWPFASSATCF